VSDTGTSPRREDISELSSETTTWPAWIRQHRAALGRGDRHAWAVLDAAVSEHQALTVIEDNPDSPAPTIRHLNPVPPATGGRDTQQGSPAVTDVSEHLRDLMAHHTRLRDLQTVIEKKTTAPEHRAQATVAARNLREALPVRIDDDAVLAQAADASGQDAVKVIGDEVFAKALAAAQPTVTWTKTGAHVEQPRGVSVTVRSWLLTMFTRAGAMGLTSSEVRNLATRRFPVGTALEVHHGKASSHLNVLEGLGFISRASDPRHPGKAISRLNLNNRSESVYFLVPGQEQAFRDYLRSLDEETAEGAAARDKATGRTTRTVTLVEPEPEPEPAPVDDEGTPLLFAS